MWSALFEFVTKFIGNLLFGKKTAEPTLAEVSSALAGAQEKLAVAEKANEVIATAAAARSDAELRVVQSVTDGAGAVDPAATNDKLAEQFPGLFRD